MSESSAFQALLWEVSNKLSAVTELIRVTREQMLTLAKEHGDMRERIATLEEDKLWKGEERRDSKERIESGNHTFILVQQQAADAERAATQALHEVKTIRDEMTAKTKAREKRRWFFVETSFKALLPHAIKAAIVIALWIAYHFTVIAKIAGTARSHGGTP